MKFFTTFAFLLILTANSYASRSLQIPPMPLRDIPTFAAIPNNQVAVSVAITYSLINVSNMPQSGTFEVLPGSLFQAAPTTSYRTYVCGTTKIIRDNAPALGSVNWQVPANGATTLTVAILAFRTLPNPAGGAGSPMFLGITPSIKITVTQDRGAIIASASPETGGNLGTGGTPFCDTISYPVTDGQITAMSVLPWLINAGRPF